MDEATIVPDLRKVVIALQARLAATEHALVVEQARRVYCEQILANVNDAIIIIDRTTQIVEWNAAASSASTGGRRTRCRAAVWRRCLPRATSMGAPVMTRLPP